MTQSNATRGPGAATRPHPTDEGFDDDRGAGWLVFAAIVLGLVGVMNTIYGIAALDNSSFYVRGAHYIIGDLKTWGWVMLAVGIVQFCAALGILAFAQWARWVGVASASLNGIVQLLAIPAAPLLSLTLFTVDMIVVYGLIAYGNRWRGT
jgi:hypothetical protein